MPDLEPLPDRVIDADLVGPVHGVRVALPHLRAGGGGALVTAGPRLVTNTQR